MADVAQAVHAAARAYGSLDVALAMTPRQLSAVMQLEASTRSRELLEGFSISRIAAHGEKKDCDKLVKDLSDGS
ncbi:hypothetical protein U5903_04200 [Cereibacter johrii]|uniref:hypothetical protein n=1 Tax=Cereibacter johrii TaxID=445629 RepID=UPI002B257D77|nr:hypothetical protein [Cereibacter johrii]MEA5159970.1 hypothetical protein [Cereibacter johrii]